MPYRTPSPPAPRPVRYAHAFNVGVALFVGAFNVAANAALGNGWAWTAGSTVAWSAWALWRTYAWDRACEVPSL